MEPLIGRIKLLGKAKIPCLILPKASFKGKRFFKDNDLIEIMLDAKTKELKVRVPQWWEMINWKKAVDIFEGLGPEVKKNISKAGQAPHPSSAKSSRR